MKRMAVGLIVCIAATAIAAAQQTQATDTTGTTATTGTVATKPPDSPLVRAAKAAGGPKHKPTTRVITNADVKKSTGKLVVLPAKPATAATPPAVPVATPAQGPIEQHDALLRAQHQAADRVTAAEKKVSDLEKELRRLEDAYYAENDPNYRDTTIAARFHQTNRQLDDARKALADARDSQEKLTTTKPSS